MKPLCCLMVINLGTIGLAGWVIWEGAAAAEDAASSRYGEHHDLSNYQRADGSRVAVRTPSDWAHRRRQIVAGMEEAMGPLPRPAEPVPLAVEVVDEREVDGLVWRKLSYHTDQRDKRLKAWLLLPAGNGATADLAEAGYSVGGDRRPAVLCLHQTTVAGKDAPVGLADRASMHYGLELARRGFVTLSPDYPSLGEHEHDFEADDYASGSMKAIYDNIRAIDLLESLPEVDPERIGCIGHSLGGHNALFTAVFDERIKAVVTSCGFTSFHKYKGGDLRGWSGPRYMPRVATRYEFSPDRMPFDFPEVLAAIAPRAVFIVAPLHDDNFDVGGVRRSVEAANRVYALLGHRKRLQVIYPNVGHDFVAPARGRAYAALAGALDDSTPILSQDRVEGAAIPDR